MKKLGILLVIGVCLGLGLPAQSGGFQSELTILDGVRFAVEPPYRILTEDSDEEQLVFARPDGPLVTGALYEATSIDDIKAEIYLFIRGYFFEDIDDNAGEFFSIERAHGFEGVPAYWVLFNLNGREHHFFAADLREAPGGRVKMIIFQSEGDAREQDRELHALVDGLTIEIQEAAG